MLEIELPNRTDIFQILVLLRKEVILLYVGAEMKNAEKKLRKEIFPQTKKCDQNNKSI